MGFVEWHDLKKRKNFSRNDEQRANTQSRNVSKKKIMKVTMVGRRRGSLG